MSERAVVVGAGGISNAWFPPLIAEGVEVVGVVDLNIDAAKRQIEKYQVDAEASTNLKALLKKTQPDFVVDLTIPAAHCAVTVTSLRAGCHVIGEKPMATSMAEARRMVHAAEESGKLYMVSQNYRMNVLPTTVRQTVNNGLIGDVTTLNCDFYIGAHFGGFRDEMPSPLLLDMSIHHFDLARYLSGGDPIAVYAREFNPKSSWYRGDVSATCVFEMSNGVIFTYRGSWCAQGFNTTWNGNWRLIGTKGSMLLEKDQPPVAQVSTKQEGFVWPVEDVQPPLVEMSSTGQLAALRDLLNYFRTGAISQTECHDNINSLAMVFAAIESSAKGRRIPVRVM